MELFLIRHAKAIDPSRHDGPVFDAHRSLTARGRRDAGEVGRALGEAGVELDALITSPLVRAVQTAELITIGLGFAEAIEVAPELASGRPPQAALEAVILPRAELRAIALVGHEPQLGLLLGQLLHRDTYGLAKSAAVRLVFDALDRPAKFRWVLRPGMSKPSTEISDVG